MFMAGVEFRSRSMFSSPLLAVVFFRLAKFYHLCMMKPNEIASIFSKYIEEGTTPKGVKIQSFFSYFTSSQKRLIAQNVSKAYVSFLEEEKEKAEIRQTMKKEIAEIKRRAKALGLTITDS